MNQNALLASARDDALCEWVDEFYLVHRYAPTVYEIGVHFQLLSKSTVHGWLKRLRREGRLDWTDNESRTLHTTEKERTR